MGAAVAAHGEQVAKVGEVLGAAVEAGPLEDEPVLDAQVGERGGDDEHTTGSSRPHSASTPYGGSSMSVISKPVRSSIANTMPSTSGAAGRLSAVMRSTLVS